MLERLARIPDASNASAYDKEMMEYFAELYKNSNKGIKGRGKDRKISATKKDRAKGEAKSNNADAEAETQSPSNSFQGSNADASFEYTGVDLDESANNDERTPYDLMMQHQAQQQQQQQAQAQQQQQSQVQSQVQQQQQLPPMRQPVIAPNNTFNGSPFAEHPSLADISRFNMDRGKYT